MQPNDSAPPPQPTVVVPPLPRVYVDAPPSWEYRRILRNLRTEDAPTEDELNALGKEGWELTGLFSDSPFLYLYFKRPQD
jgi:hypothetical protein